MRIKKAFRGPNTDSLKCVAKWFHFIILNKLDYLRILIKGMTRVKLCFKKGNLESLCKIGWKEKTKNRKTIWQGVMMKNEMIISGQSWDMVNLSLGYFHKHLTELCLPLPITVSMYAVFSKGPARWKNGVGEWADHWISNPKYLRKQFSSLL